MRISSPLSSAPNDSTLVVSTANQETPPEKSLLQSGNWCDGVQNTVLEFLASVDQLALTCSCMKWSVSRYDAIIWKNRFKRTFAPKTEEEFFQILKKLKPKSFPAIKFPIKLDLSSMTVIDEALESYLSALLPLSDRIQTLTLDIRARSEEGFESFRHLPKLSKLKITKLNRSLFHSLLQCKHLSSLITLDLSENKIGDTGAELLAASKNLRSLKELNLGGNGIGDAGAQALAESTYLRSLGWLDLGRNGIGCDGVSTLARSEIMDSIQYLSLISNNIGDHGVRALAASDHLRSLKTLDLSLNAIGDDGARALAASNHLPSLDEVYCYGNRISDMGHRGLLKYLPEDLSEVD